MTIFNDTAEALCVDPDARNRAWAAVGASGLSPDDPEVVRILITEHLNSQIKKLSSDLALSAGKAISDFNDAQTRSEAAAQARLETRTTELAQTVSARIAIAIEQTLEKRADAKLDNAQTTQWACGAILFGVGLYLGMVCEGYVNVPDDQLNRWLQAQSPYFLLLVGTVAFFVIRLVVAWTATSPLIRFILALPPRDAIRGWNKRDY
ncbi:hypothetical protein [Acetobacter senegalensis]|uniref:hypothetical protein n=1 Tax=Acetobacter senegalensis TaxID=446692 RepID=UPI00264BD56A|nr:hypothetical protein [Acetobacter senegalensis]MDN7350009.1 hypothetical protein [Acetobacter senegalensis]